MLPSNVLNLPQIYERLIQPNCALVYQMGKVASVATCKSLERVGMDCLHIHSLRPSLIYRFLRGYEAVGQLEERAAGLMLWNEVRACLVAQEIQSNLKTITLFRDPVARMVSGCFESLMNVNRNRYWQGEQLNVSRIVEKIRALAEDFKPNMSRLAMSAHFDDCPNVHFGTAAMWSELAFCLTWFDEELQEHFGIDIANFPVAGLPYRRVGKVLMIKYEAIGHQVEGAVADMVKRPDFKFLSGNVTSDRDSLYSDVVHNLKFPRDFLDWVYDNKYCHCLYSPEELENFRAKWAE